MDGWIRIMIFSWESGSGRCHYGSARQLLGKVIYVSFLIYRNNEKIMKNISDGQRLYELLSFSFTENIFLTYFFYIFFIYIFLFTYKQLFILTLNFFFVLNLYSMCVVNFLNREIFYRVKKIQHLSIFF